MEEAGEVSEAERGEIRLGEEDESDEEDEWGEAEAELERNTEIIDTWKLMPPELKMDWSRKVLAPAPPTEETQGEEVCRGPMFQIAATEGEPRDDKGEPEDVECGPGVGDAEGKPGAGDVKGEGGKQDSHIRAHLINTPSSLMALGNHIATVRHGKIWEFRNKSPLEGN